jgi:hypothetical protein
MLGVSLCLLASSALRLVFLGSHGPASRWIAVFQVVCSLLLVLSNLPSYCEFQETCLVLRQGWRKKFSIPYASVTEVEGEPPPASEFARGRVLVSTSDGKRLVISVAEKARFVREALRRCPQLSPAT